MKTAEERLESLEGDNYFLSEKLRELDDVLVSQQKQIDRLEKALEEAVSAIGRLRASMEELSSGKNAQELIITDCLVIDSMLPYARSFAEQGKPIEYFVDDRVIIKGGKEE